MKISRPSSKWIITSIASERFFWGVVILLVVQAAWIALSGRYPMAFDEDFHIGIIHLYAHHLNPFWSATPADSEAFGAVARDPSYLYHYFLSFPYRLLESIHASVFQQIMVLRALNIGLFAFGIVIYRHLLQKTGSSKAIIHFCLLIFVLIPISPLLAAQINYDNLIIPITALTLLLTHRLIDRSSRTKLDVTTLSWLIILSLSASLVKYAYLPVFASILIFLIVSLWKKYNSFKQILNATIKGVKAVSKPTMAILIIAITLTSILFVERYAINLLKYHKPVADCAEVLDYEHCQYYGPWIRDYNFNLKKGPVETSPIKYSQHWVYGMWFRSFFAVDGPDTGFQTRGPLLLPGLAVIGASILGISAFVATAPKIWRKYNKHALWLFSLVVVLHITALWLEEYRLFVKTGQPVAINGRYLLPIMPILIILATLGAHELLRGYKKLQLLLAAILVLCFVWGGGAMTYILRSNNSWYWDNLSLVEHVNYDLQQIIGPITPGNTTPNEFLH